MRGEQGSDPVALTALFGTPLANLQASPGESVDQSGLALACEGLGLPPWAVGRKVDPGHSQDLPWGKEERMGFVLGAPKVKSC